MKTHPLLIASKAEEDTTDAYLWYETHREGLGEQFLSCLQETLDSIQRAPEMYAKVHDDIRRALIRRFPYGVFYILHGDSVQVLAIFHHRRDPKQLKNR